MNINKKVGLDPLVNMRTKILILGTLPGDKSLKCKEYYADTKNHFWDIVFRILDENWSIDKLVHEEIPYEQRCNFLLDHGIGLWDILEKAYRTNSSDSTISEQAFNDLPNFLSQNNNIEFLFFNGQKAFDYCNKQFPQTLASFRNEILNSTSSRNTTNVFVIIKQWKKAIKNSIPRIKLT